MFKGLKWFHFWAAILVVFFLTVPCLLFIWWPGYTDANLKPLLPEGQWYDASKIAKAAEEKMQLRALYGDSYGSLNALFAGLAFAGLLSTIAIQFMYDRQRNLERHEDLKRQSEDAFDQRFFHLLTSLKEAGARITGDNGEIVDGAGRLVSHLHKTVYSSYAVRMPSVDFDVRNIFMQDFRTLMSKKEHELGPFFRLLEVLVFDILSKNQKDSVRREGYLEILRAELSGAQLALISFYCRTDQGAHLSKFLPQADLFRYMPSRVKDLDKEFLTEGLVPATALNSPE